MPTPGRLLRAGLAWEAALLAILGGAVFMWAGSPVGAASFGCQAIVDLVLAWWIVRRPWGDDLAWRLRIAGSLWLFLSVPIAVAFVFTPSAWDLSRLLGVDPGSWIGLVAFSGFVLLWLASAGSWRRTASREEAPANAGPQRRWGKRLGWTGAFALLAASVLPIWPIAGIVATVQMGGCAPAWLVPSDPVFCVRGTLDGRTLTVSGHTSLPDGSIVTAWINDPSTEDLTGESRLTVHGGAFSASFDLSRVAADRVWAMVEFNVAALEKDGPGVYILGQPYQSQAVVDRYGQDGSGMVGPTAVWQLSPLFLNSAPEFQVLRVELEFALPKQAS